MKAPTLAKRIIFLLRGTKEALNNYVCPIGRLPLAEQRFKGGTRVNNEEGTIIKNIDLNKKRRIPISMNGF
jgi:hypothetical protein